MKKIMEINKETALRLWKHFFGNAQKASDFTGRIMAKAAYNDRNSEFGWNIDHILPQSRGGKTADHNLICCHILTNDEKADKFPCFTANGKSFEIQKKQNHFEIVAKDSVEETDDEDSINFFDVAEGLKCWKDCKTRDGNIFVGYVKIRVITSNDSTQLLERFERFLIKLFNTKEIFVKEDFYVYKKCYTFTVIKHDIDTKEDTQNLLDDSIILNTYVDHFLRTTGFEDIKIVCGMECYKSDFEMSCNIQRDIIDKRVEFPDGLSITELIKINTVAKEKLGNTVSNNCGYHPYNRVYTQLHENLKKQN